ncbi:MAG TPA: type II toxin-antitoxin system RelE/ParE family toxin [Candidatus Binataceae bacterium]|nr:type II toxin-antitoxin system RelE/ParE family toxin [Candidatus Binataceae bacterium]
MTGRYILSPRAQRDIDEIWDYTAKRWGVDQAEIYTRQLGHDVEAVAAQPAIGRACPELRTGYYRFPSGGHVLFYRRIEGGIEIVRVLHARMDFAQHI